MSKQRLFLSLNPDERVISELLLIQQKLKEHFSMNNIRWAYPDNFHLTLRFLGDVDSENIIPLIETLKRLKFEFETILFTAEQIGFFPEGKYPNVIYAGFKEIGNNADILTGFIDRIIYNFKIKPEMRFVPHITLGRFKRTNRVKITEPLSTAIGKFTCEFDSFYLMKSTLNQNGSVYEVLGKINFLK